MLSLDVWRWHQKISLSILNFPHWIVYFVILQIGLTLTIWGFNRLFLAWVAASRTVEQTMETLFPYLAIATYLFGTLAVGLIGYRRQKNTVEDYFLANRNIGSALMFFTLVATNFSAFFFLGFAGSGYRIGISYYPMMAFGTGFAALSFYYIGYRAWFAGQTKRLHYPSRTH